MKEIMMHNWANYLQSVFRTKNFAKKYWISMKILSPKILDFYEFFLSKYWTSTKFFVEVQYFDKYFCRSPVFWDLEFSYKSSIFSQNSKSKIPIVDN